MILAREEIAWVRSEDGRLTPFDAHRLADSIQLAARGAGHADWWLAESVAAAVQLYARQCLRGSTIAMQEMVEIVVAVLSALGYTEISEAYAQQRRRVRIQLDELSARADEVFELRFFRELDGALNAATDKRLSLLEVRGLRRCVMQLRGVRRWDAACRRLAEEIVQYIRARVTRMRPQRAASLKLAVLE